MPLILDDKEKERKMPFPTRLYESLKRLLDVFNYVVK